MSVLNTATFTISIDEASDDELEAAAAAFTCTLHRAGLTPADALAAWSRMDDWERSGFPAAADPGRPWRRTMSVARDAAVAAFEAAGMQGQQRPFVIRSGPRPS